MIHPALIRGLITLGFGGVLMACSVVLPLFSQDAGAEAQQTGTPLSNPTTSTTQAGQVAKITPEQEAALVEVRKILREAQEVAEAIQVPSRLLTDRHRVKALEQVKAQLLDDIDKAQLRAGDFSAAETTKYIDLLALAQAAYGKTQDAVQTTSRPRIVDGDPLLILVDILTGSGDISAALKAVDATLTKGVTQWDHAQRARHRAEALALIAQRQQESGDHAAKATLQGALAAAQDVIDPDGSYWAFLHVARVQGLLGDRASSTESIRQALKAARGRRNEELSSQRLMWIAKAQAEAGDAAASQQTFQRAILEGTGYVDLACLAWAQDVTGDHQAAARSLKLAIDGAGKLSPEEQAKALHYIAQWQMKIGARDAAAATIEQLRRSGALVDARVLAIRFGFFDRALAIDAEMQSTDAERASFLRHLVKRLVETGDPIGTNEKFQQLSKEATLLRDRLPKDRSKSEWMLADIALVEAAAGDLTSARQTIEKTPDGGPLSVAYKWIVDVLVRKGELTTATQIASEIRDSRRPFATVFRDLGNAYGKSGEVAAGLTWARQQENSYARTNSLLGIAEGIMKAERITAKGWSDNFFRNRCPLLTDGEGNPI